MSKLVDKINNLLPQTQCTRCGYDSCKSYAKALIEEKADINQCPPGGNEGITKLAKLLNKSIKPLNPKNGAISAKTNVVIDQEACIGCTLCIKACPVDAIVGSNKMIHTVISDECTGCDLCIPACPVDCIEIVIDKNPEWSSERIKTAKTRYENKINRQNKIKERQLQALDKKSYYST